MRKKMKLLNILKYAFSVIILAAVTFTVLYFPGIYFEHYQYDMVIEDLEQHSYEELEQQTVNFWQIYELIKNQEPIQAESYVRNSANYQECLAKDAFYLDMIGNVFKKYLKIVEKKEEILAKDMLLGKEIEIPVAAETGIMGESEGKGEMIYEDSLLENYVNDWLVAKSDWQVNEAKLYYFTGIIDSKMVNMQMYIVTLEILDIGAMMNICFDPETAIFYNVDIVDSRYLLADTDKIYLDLYVYYGWNEEDWGKMTEEERVKLMSMIECYTNVGEMSIRVLMR